MVDWKVQTAETKVRNRDKIDISKPDGKEFNELKEKAGPLVNYAPNHCLNTTSALKAMKDKHKDVTACCMAGTDILKFFIGYGDGLICFWEQS